MPIDGCGEGEPSATEIDDSKTAVTPGDKKPELSGGDDSNKTNSNNETLTNNVDATENETKENEANEATNEANESTLSNNINNKQHNNNHGM